MEKTINTLINIGEQFVINFPRNTINTKRDYYETVFVKTSDDLFYINIKNYSEQKAILTFLSQTDHTQIYWDSLPILKEMWRDINKEPKSFIDLRLVYRCLSNSCDTYINNRNLKTLVTGMPSEWYLNEGFFTDIYSDSYIKYQSIEVSAIYKYYMEVSHGNH